MINKQEKMIVVNDTFAGGFPVPKYNAVEHVHKTDDSVLPGTIRTNRTGGIMRPQSNRTLLNNRLFNDRAVRRGQCCREVN